MNLKTGILFSILLIPGQNLFGLPSLSELKINRKNLSFALPADQQFQYVDISYNSMAKKYYTNTYIINSQRDENTGEMDISQSFIPTNTYVEYSMQLDSSLFINQDTANFYNTNVSKLYEFDKRISSRDNKNNKWIVRYYMGGKKTREVDFDSSVLEADTLYLYLQALINKGITNSFYTDVFITPKGLQLPVDFNFFRTKDLQKMSPDCKLPDKFIKASRLGENFYGYYFQLEQPFTAIYPFKIFLIFREASPHTYFGFWWTDPNNYLFQIMDLDELK